MSIRDVFVTLLLIFRISAVHAGDEVTIQPQISAACTNGGTVALPAVVTLGATLNLNCPGPSTRPVLLKGAPSEVSCAGVSGACITIGSTNSSERPNLRISDMNLKGPGRTTAGSIGISVANTGGNSRLDHVRIDDFDKGLYVDGSSFLMGHMNITDIVIGVPNASTNTAVHLAGSVANVKFVNFGLSAQQRLVLMDGIGGTGGGASFESGYFNTTQTAGIPAISVSTTDHTIKALNISNVEDWETRCPYLELGDGGWATLTGIGWWQNPIKTTSGQDAIHILPGATAWLKMTAAAPGACTTTNASLIKNESASGAVWISSSDLAGKINYTVGGHGMFVGNRCGTSDGTSTFTGVTTNMRSQASIGTCPNL